jgi:twitching motility two-component system response regulator PilH
MKRIVIVEDDRGICALLTHILEGQNFGVTCAFDGIDGLEKIREISPDIVMMDINMPHLNGMELLETLKSSPKTSRIPIIMCTENAKIGSVDDAYVKGADSYIIKPFTAGQVIRKVREVLQIQ